MDSITHTFQHLHMTYLVLIASSMFPRDNSHVPCMYGGRCMILFALHQAVFKQNLSSV